MRFQSKAFAGSILGVAVLAAVTGAIALHQGKVHLQRTIESDFHRAPMLVSRQLQRRLSALQLDVGAWAEDKRYAAWLGRASSVDAPGGKVAPADLKAAHDGLGALELTTWDEFQVMNDAGILLLDARRQDAMGEDRSADPAIRRALAGEVVMRLRGPLLEMVHAVSVEGSVRGILLAAIPLAPIREDLELALRSQVRFDSTPSADSRVRTVSSQGETWLTCSVPVQGVTPGETIFSVTLTRSLSKELAPLVKDLLVAIGLGTGAGLLLAVGLAFLLARALSAPISVLVAATRRLGKGDFTQRVSLRSTDELRELGSAFNQMAAELKHRVFFESALRRYLAAPVVEQLIREPQRLQLGGETREVSVLFFDVAGFTKLAEKLAAAELVALMNGYLDELVAAIFAHGGTFDKFVGDAVVAFWGAPIPQPDHAARACRAAKDMQRALQRFALAHADPRVRGLRSRIGINTGPAVLGNLGSTQIMSYTAMGDTVNVASRLEGVNKMYGTDILVAESTVRSAACTAVREVDQVRVSGRAGPLRIFQLLDDEAAAAAPALTAYSEGLLHLRAHRFAEAQRLFFLAQERGDEGCAAVMAARAAALAAHPPADDWDGTYDLPSK